MRPPCAARVGGAGGSGMSRRVRVPGTGSTPDPGKKCHQSSLTGASSGFLVPGAPRREPAILRSRLSISGPPLREGMGIVPKPGPTVLFTGLLEGALPVRRGGSVMRPPCAIFNGWGAAYDPYWRSSSCAAGIPAIYWVGIPFCICSCCRYNASSTGAGARSENCVVLGAPYSAARSCRCNI